MFIASSGMVMFVRPVHQAFSSVNLLGSVNKLTPYAKLPIKLQEFVSNVTKVML